MRSRNRLRVAALCVVAATLALATEPVAAHHDDAEETELADARYAAAQDRPGGLEPTRPSPQPEESSWYNGEYLFAMTRGVRDSTIHPAGQVPLFLFTIPLDTALLPFAAIAGLFG